MTYDECIAYLYTATPAFHQIGGAAYKPGLHNMEALMTGVGNPHCALRVIHIAGTNGKGSTSHLLAAALQAAGKRVGLYTSPHLVDYRERIRINGAMIPQQAVVSFVEQYKDLIESIHPSFFEITTALAFDYFVREQVDVAVIEVGLGGRLDSTNILPPYDPVTSMGVLLSVITNIGFDHTEFLGTTLAAIAAEKAGIMKVGVPCVIGETDERTEPVFMRKAGECGILGEGLETTDCRIWFADQCGYLNRCRLRDVPDCELKGDYQQHNMQTAYVALRTLMSFYPDLHLTTAAIREGFAQVCSLTGLRGRWERLRLTTGAAHSIGGKNPLIICDTGHNDHGIRYVVEQLARLLSEHPTAILRVVFGMVQDKDVEDVLRRMRSSLPSTTRYYFAAANTKRAIPANDLVDRMGSGRAFDSVEQAIENAIKETSDEDIIFIGGSNYIVGQALAMSVFQ